MNHYPLLLLSFLFFISSSCDEQLEDLVNSQSVIKEEIASGTDEVSIQQDTVVVKYTPIDTIVQENEIVESNLIVMDESGILLIFSLYDHFYSGNSYKLHDGWYEYADSETDSLFQGHNTFSYVCVLALKEEGSSECNSITGGHLFIESIENSDIKKMTAEFILKNSEEPLFLNYLFTAEQSNSTTTSRIKPSF